MRSSGGGGEREIGRLCAIAHDLLDGRAPLPVLLLEFAIVEQREIDQIIDSWFGGKRCRIALLDGGFVRFAGVE